MARRVLFVQGADPAFYPPIMHAAAAMADAGWRVTILSTPQAKAGLMMPAHLGIDEIRTKARPSYLVSGGAYLTYNLEAIRTALRLRPHVVYASDPLGAGPGLIAAWLAGARLVYHEHDSPNENSPSRALIRWARYLCFRTAELVIFPNAERGKIVTASIGCDPKKLRIAWNVPSRQHLPAVRSKLQAPIAIYYHGSITPERLPPSVPEAIARFGGAAVLRIAGYEAPTGRGYVSQLQERWGVVEKGGLIDWIGSLPHHHQLLAEAGKAHIGLALMPMNSVDINMAHMEGASNKAFDYMAAEMALVVSDLPEWRKMFVEPGHAIACDPSSADSVEAALRWLIDHPDERSRMARLSREKIEQTWNYETVFGPILTEIESALTSQARISPNDTN